MVAITAGIFTLTEKLLRSHRGPSRGDRERKKNPILCRVVFREVS